MPLKTTTVVPASSSSVVAPTTVAACPLLLLLLYHVPAADRYSRPAPIRRPVQVRTLHILLFFFFFSTINRSLFVVFKYIYYTVVTGGTIDDEVMCILRVVRQQIALYSKPTRVIGFAIFSVENITVDQIDITQGLKILVG